MDEQKDQEEKKDQFDWQLMLFFVKIIRTVFLGMFWMLINMFLGLYLGFGVPEESTPLRMWLFYGWRILENRNKATSLYALYTRYSHDRRGLEQTLAANDKTKSEEVTEQVEIMEASAEAFIQAAEEQQIEPRKNS